MADDFIRDLCARVKDHAARKAPLRLRGDRDFVVPTEAMTGTLQNLLVRTSHEANGRAPEIRTAKSEGIAGEDATISSRRL